MITIIDYGANNTDQLENTISEFNLPFTTTSDEYEILQSDKIILYSESKADYAIRRFHLMNFFSMFRMLKKPLLAVGTGMHLLCEHSAEGNVACLGIIPSCSLPLTYDDAKEINSGLMKIDILKYGLLFEGISSEDLFCFEQQFYVPVNDFTTATADSVPKISAVVQHNNFIGIQFNPLKSEAGKKVLKNFLTKF